MPVHPNPISMAAHVEHHRQELLEQAHQVRLAKEAIAARDRVPDRLAENTVAVVRLRSAWARLRPDLTESVDLPQSAPGEAL